MAPTLGPRREIVPLRAVVSLKTVMAETQKELDLEWGTSCLSPGPGLRRVRALWGQVGGTGHRESVTVGLGGPRTPASCPSSGMTTHSRVPGRQSTGLVCSCCPEVVITFTLRNIRVWVV